LFHDRLVLLTTPGRDAILFVAPAPFVIRNEGLDPLKGHALMRLLRSKHIRNQAIFVNQEISRQLIVAAVAWLSSVGGDVPKVPELFHVREVLQRLVPRADQHRGRGPLHREGVVHRPLPVAQRQGARAHVLPRELAHVLGRAAVDADGDEPRAREHLRLAAHPVDRVLAQRSGGVAEEAQEDATPAEGGEAVLLAVGADKLEIRSLVAHAEQRFLRRGAGGSTARLILPVADGGRSAGLPSSRKRRSS